VSAERGASAAAVDTETRRGPGRAEDGGSLPFTGLAVVGVALLGAGLLATGAGLRRSAGRDV
jgi:hypothetical protein